MRNDAIIDKRFVHCPNSSHSGYSKWRSQVGDLVFWSMDGTESATMIGRMIGRIHYAPALEGDKEPVRDYILAVKLSQDMTYTSEFWVNPKLVTRVESIRNQSDVLAWFLSNQMVKEPLADVRQCSSDGWSTFAKFQAWRKSTGVNTDA